jgi:hypothetical protein
MNWDNTPRRHNFLNTPTGEWLCRISLTISFHYDIEHWAPWNIFFGITYENISPAQYSAHRDTVHFPDCWTLEAMRLRILELNPGMGIKIHLLIEEYKDWLREQDSSSPLLGG